MSWRSWRKASLCRGPRRVLLCRRSFLRTLPRIISILGSRCRGVPHPPPLVVLPRPPFEPAHGPRAPRRRYDPPRVQAATKEVEEKSRRPRRWRLSKIWRTLFLHREELWRTGELEQKEMMTAPPPAAAQVQHRRRQQWRRKRGRGRRRNERGSAAETLGHRSTPTAPRHPHPKKTRHNNRLLGMVAGRQYSSRALPTPLWARGKCLHGPRRRRPLERRCRGMPGRRLQSPRSNNGVGPVGPSAPLPREEEADSFRGLDRSCWWIEQECRSVDF